jgi:hypothetical protein
MHYKCTSQRLRYRCTPSHPRLAIAQRGYMKLAFATPFVIWHCALQTHFSSVLVTVALKQGRESRTTP